MRKLLLFLCLTSFASVVLAGLLGSPFLINGTPSGVLVAAAAAPNGETSPFYRDGTSGYIRRYSAGGADLTGGDFFVGTSSDRVALAKNGNYVVVRTAADANGNGVYAKVYNRAGATVVPEFLVNAVTTGDQFGALVAMDANNGFVVAWYQAQGSNPTRIFAKRFTATGSVSMADTEVTAGQSGTELLCSLVMDAAGNFLVGWINLASSVVDVYLRRYPVSGSPSSFVRANTYTTSTQDGIQIGMNANGDTVAIWESYGQDGSERGIYAQRYSQAFVAQGSEFRVNTTTVGSQTLAGVGMADDGSFIVSWIHDNRLAVPGSIPNVAFQQFTSGGVAVGGESFINPVAGSSATYSAVATDPAGNGLIAWRTYSSSTSTYSTYGQRLLMDTLPPVTAITSGQVLSSLSGAIGGFRHYRIFVPAGATTVNVNLNGPGSGDANLYVRAGAQPTTVRWDVRPQTLGNTESISIGSPPAGELYVSVYGQSAYVGVGLTVTVY